MAVLVPDSMVGQEIGITGSRGWSDEWSVPDPWGTGVFLLVNSSRYLGVKVALGRQSGMELYEGHTCATYWPFFEDCLPERVSRSADLTTAELSGWGYLPPVRGFRLGAGVGGALHWSAIGLEGLETGRSERPVISHDPAPALTWGVSLDRAILPGERIRASLTLSDHIIYFGPCAMDTWAVCDMARLRSLQLGLAYRVR